jgi:hypothetical protein
MEWPEMTSLGPVPALSAISPTTLGFKPAILNACREVDWGLMRMMHEWHACWPDPGLIPELGLW